MHLVRSKEDWFGDAVGMVGRASDLAALHEVIASGARCVTLVGPSGMGKSTLADALCRQLGDTRRLEPSALCGDAPSGPWAMVDLNRRPGPDQMGTLRRWIGGGLRLVCVAPAPLGLLGEAVHVVGPLELEAAAALLNRQCRLANSRFAVQSDQKTHAVVQAVGRWPLPIVLLGKRAGWMTLDEMMAWMEEPFELLVDPVGAGRHRSMAAAMEHWWEGSDDEVRVAVGRFSRFQGSFDLPAALAILGTEGVLDPISRLVAQGWLVRVPGQPRFFMPALVRAWVRRHHNDEAGARAFVDHHTAKADRWVRALDGVEGGTALVRLGADRDNFMSALELAGRLRPSGLPALTLAVCAALRSGGSRLEERMELLARALPHAGASELAVDLLSEAILVAAEQGEVARLENSLALLRTAGGANRQRVRVLSGEAMLTWARGDAKRARQLWEDARAAADPVEDARWCARLWLVSGKAAASLDPELASTQLRAAADGFAALEDEVGELRATAALAVLRCRAGCDDGVDGLHVSITHSKALGLSGLVGTLRSEMAVALYLSGRHDAAAAELQAAISRHRLMGDARSEVRAEAWLGAIACETGDIHSGWRALQRAILRLRRMQDRDGLLRALALAATYAASCDGLGSVSRCALEARDAAAGASTWLRGPLLALVEAAAATEAVRAARRAEGPVQELVSKAHGALARLEAMVTKGGDWRCLRQPTAMLRDAAGGEGSSVQPVLRVADDATWFCAPGQAPVELWNRPQLRRVLDFLVEQRRAAPGVGVSKAEILKNCWPGERMLEQSAANRIYVSLSALRRLGLRGLIERCSEGYRLSMDVEIRRVQGRSSRDRV
jgi:hypothetical protein